MNALYIRDLSLANLDPREGSGVLIKPFIKWAGGKRWLASRLATHFEVLEGRYIEPFLGSGAVFFEYTPARAILSDANAELITTYQAISDQPQLVKSSLVRLASGHSKDHFYRVRASRPRKPHTVAARFLYLNRTCWNGLYRVNRKGEFNVPIGTKEKILFENEDFRSISKILQNASISCSDFEQQIESAESGDLIFADPPYTVSHNNNGFIKYNENIFSWNDQIRLAKSLTRAANRGCKIISTNAAHDDLRSLYENNFEVSKLDRHTVISGQNRGRQMTSELFVTNL